MHRRRIVVGNWKMNGRLTSGLTLAQDLVKKAELNRPEGYDLVICPPFTLSWPVSEVVVGTPVHLGAQDCHVDTHGAFTGDVSAAMLVDVGCRYVILGHSERRRDHGETDALVQKKIQAAHQAGLTAVVCVGESRQVRDAGDAASFVSAQVKSIMSARFTPENLVIAYEPIWAIGTGVTPSPDEITDIHETIRGLFGQAGAQVRIVYGGSVTPQSAEGIIRLDEVDGFLVGAASLNSDGFWHIAQFCHGRW